MNPRGLGTDGCASNNNLDMFAEMDTVAKLHKVRRLDPTVMDARTVVHLATKGSARVLGLARQVGTIEPVAEIAVGETIGEVVDGRAIVGVHQLEQRLGVERQPPHGAGRQAEGDVDQCLLLAVAVVDTRGVQRQAVHCRLAGQSRSAVRT